MLAGTLVTVIGLMPVGFARSTAGEYAGNIFWIVGFALITSWFVAVIFTPYLGVKMLPDIKPIPGGHAAIYATPNYRRLRRLVGWSVRHKFIVAGAVCIVAALCYSEIASMISRTSSTPGTLIPSRSLETAVFADVPMPERDAIAHHQCCECETLRATFAGRHWSTFDASLLEANYDQLPLLSPEGLAFYLPAYVLHALASLHAPDNATDYTVWHLAPTHENVDPDKNLMVRLVRRVFPVTSEFREGALRHRFVVARVVHRELGDLCRIAAEAARADEHRQPLVVQLRDAGDQPFQDRLALMQAEAVGLAGGAEHPQGLDLGPLAGTLAVLDDLDVARSGHAVVVGCALLLGHGAPEDQQLADVLDGRGAEFVGQWPGGGFAQRVRRPKRADGAARSPVEDVAVPHHSSVWAAAWRD